MTRPLIIDAVMFHDELDVLEMRLTELGDVVDRFVIVEATVTHQGNPKPMVFADNRSRFEAWADKIVYVAADGLPSVADDPDPWAREHAQRDWIQVGLEQINTDLPDGLPVTSVVMQSDVDEIPRPFHVRNCRPGTGFVSFGQRGHFWAVDWLHPHVWHGTVAGTVAGLVRLGARPFNRMRDMRNVAPCPPHMQDAGWHFSWLGGPDRALKKVGAYCHPEVTDRIVGGIDDGLSFWRDGVHTDGVKMAPVDVDGSWPKWITDGNAPKEWLRPK